MRVGRLGRGSSFGEAELLAAAEAEEGAAVLAAAMKHRLNSQKSLSSSSHQQHQQQQQQSQAETNKTVAMLVSAGGGGGESGSNEPPQPAPPRKKSTPIDGHGRGAARRGGVARAVRAVCVSKTDCEVMAVPRHLFATLLDELGGVRRKLQHQVGRGGGSWKLPIRRCCAFFLFFFFLFTPVSRFVRRGSHSSPGLF